MHELIKPVLAVDPGKATGWVMYDVVSEDILCSGTHNDFKTFGRRVERTFFQNKITVVCEDFKITQETIRKARQYESLYLIGILYHITHNNPRVFNPLVIQSRNIKSFATDDKLKALGWWTPGNNHENDAKRHLLAYLWQTKQIEAERFIDGES